MLPGIKSITAIDIRFFAVKIVSTMAVMSSVLPRVHNAGGAQLVYTGEGGTFPPSKCNSNGRALLLLLLLLLLRWRGGSGDDRLQLMSASVVNSGDQHGTCRFLTAAASSYVRTRLCTADAGMVAMVHPSSKNCSRSFASAGALFTYHPSSLTCQVT